MGEASRWVKEAEDRGEKNIGGFFYCSFHGKGKARQAE
jgi:hypothetical protein